MDHDLPWIAGSHRGGHNPATVGTDPAEASLLLPRRVWILAVVLATVLAGWQGHLLYQFWLQQARVPMWDMAQNGWRGLELALDLKAGRFFSFAAALNRHGTLPFGYSLFLVPFFLLRDYSFATATIAQVVTFAAIPAFLLGASCLLDRTRAGLFAGLIATAFFVTAPLARLFAVLIMRELLGGLGTLICLFLYLRAREDDSLLRWRAAGVAALSLFFVKYNYGLPWIVSVVAFDLMRQDDSTRQAIKHRLIGWLWPWRGGYGASARRRFILAKSSPSCITVRATWRWGRHCSSIRVPCSPKAWPARQGWWSWLSR